MKRIFQMFGLLVAALGFRSATSAVSIKTREATEMKRIVESLPVETLAASDHAICT